jgi:hypothetical protein
MGYVLVVACAVGAGVRADMAADRMCGAGCLSSPRLTLGFRSLLGVF